MTDEPLIFTSKGNMPCASLTYHHEWTVNEDLVKFREWYTDASGEIVKDSSHLYLPKGMLGQAQPGSFA